MNSCVSAKKMHKTGRIKKVIILTISAISILLLLTIILNPGQNKFEKYLSGTPSGYFIKLQGMKWHLTFLSKSNYVLFTIFNVYYVHPHEEETVSSKYIGFLNTFIKIRDEY